MPNAPTKAPGKILGVPTKWAVVIVLVVFVGVWYYLKNRSTSVATQTQTTPQVAATGSTDSTGGVSASPDLSSLLDALAQNTAAIAGLTTGSGTYATPTDTATAPAAETSNYYNAPYESPSTTSYTYNYAGASPAAPQGAVNPVPASPVSTPTIPSIGKTKVGSNFTVNPVAMANSSYAGQSTKFLAQ